MAYTPDALPWIPVIYNEAMALANTEYSQALPYKTMKFMVKMRNDSQFSLAFDTGQVPPAAGDYLTVPANRGGYWDDHVNLDPTGNNAITLYFSSTNAGMVAEIVAWIPWT